MYLHHSITCTRLVNSFNIQCYVTIRNIQFFRLLNNLYYYLIPTRQLNQSVILVKLKLPILLIYTQLDMYIYI